MEETKIITIKIGTKYLKIKAKNPAARNGEDNRTSSINTFTPTLYAIKIVESNAETGIKTELVAKSNISSKFIFDTLIKSKTP